MTSGRLSHSSGPLNGGGGSLAEDSPPVSPTDDFDDIVKVSLSLSPSPVNAVLSFIFSAAFNCGDPFFFLVGSSLLLFFIVDHLLRVCN